MHTWKDFQKHLSLIAATGAILLATLALVLMQYRSVRRAEGQAQALLEANLDLHLLTLVSEAKRDMVEHADHIAHSIYQRLVRERDVPALQRAFTRASHRFPEIRDFYVVFFERGRERETWRALHFIPANANDARALKYNGAAVGSLAEDAEMADTLLHAWLALADHTNLATVTAQARLPNAVALPSQLFFHPVYEAGRVERQDRLTPIGLIVLTADVENYPAPDYLRGLLVRHMARAADQGLREQPVYQVSVSEGEAKRTLTAAGEMIAPLRQRGFDESDRLFPSLRFSIAPRDAHLQAPANDYARLSILLGFCAAGLALVGLVMTWRAVRREMKVAQLKSDFLASISHELKTPLTAIRAFGDLLHSGRVRNAERIHEYGELIKAESDRLTALINNILELSRLERGVRRYRLEEGVLCVAVAETVEVFRHTVEARGFTIDLTLPTSPINANFDESALRQALLNLLSNAVRYAGATEAGRHIEVTVERHQAEAVIAVRDHGPGIAASEQRRIFTPFYRAPQSTEPERGLGIGLAIVREVIEAHGGDASVESELGSGATFRLRLPLMVTSEEPVRLEVAPQSLSESR